MSQDMRGLWKLGNAWKGSPGNPQDDHRGHSQRDWGRPLTPRQ